jgi:hypothetical protein
MPRPHPPEFRQRAVELARLRANRPLSAPLRASRHATATGCCLAWVGVDRSRVRAVLHARLTLDPPAIAEYLFNIAPET